MMISSKKSNPVAQYSLEGVCLLVAVVLVMGGISYRKIMDGEFIGGIVVMAEVTSTLEVEEDGDNFQESETTETVISDNGSVVEIKREVEDDGKIEVITTTTDVDGSVTVEKTKTEDNGTQKTKLSELKIKAQNGEVVKLKIKEKDADGEDVESRVDYNVENQKLEIRSEQGGPDYAKVKIKVHGDKFQITRAGIGVATHFPMTVDEETGEISVTTGIGEVQLKAMPDTIKEKAELAGVLDQVESIDLVEDDDDGVRYEVKGQRVQKFFGVLDVGIPMTLNYHATSGKLVSTHQSFFSQVLDFFSF